MPSHHRVKGKGGGKRTTERKRNSLHPPLFQLEVVVDGEVVTVDCFSWKEVKKIVTGWVCNVVCSKDQTSNVSSDHPWPISLPNPPPNYNIIADVLEVATLPADELEKIHYGYELRANALALEMVIEPLTTESNKSKLKGKHKGKPLGSQINAFASLKTSPEVTDKDTLSSLEASDITTSEPLVPKQNPDLDGVDICDSGMDPLEVASLGQDFTYAENSDWLREARVVRKVKGRQNVDTIFDILNQINDNVIGLSSRMDRLETRMDRLETRMDRLETKVDDLYGGMATLYETSARQPFGSFVQQLLGCTILRPAGGLNFKLLTATHRERDRQAMKSYLPLNSILPSRPPASRSDTSTQRLFEQYGAAKDVQKSFSTEVDGLLWTDEKSLERNIIMVNIHREADVVKCAALVSQSFQAHEIESYAELLDEIV
ncbi:hypothetical protein HDU67_001979 [Dinochytrium kinnereticum]|nr:hypothetical protein HDU67_001979 [Dinochytrium kinnereticum]